jgi:two-component system, chemotaxis family, chemotaxis protein CheY
MKTILVVDDSPTIRRMVKVALGELPDVRFVESSSGLQAIEQLTLTQVALVVLDLNMPDVHGLEVLNFVRRHPSYRTLPVLVLTTRGDDSSREAALKAGATVYLTKPFTPDGLAREVRAILASPAPGGSSEQARVER